MSFVKDNKFLIIAAVLGLMVPVSIAGFSKVKGSSEGAVNSASSPQKLSKIAPAVGNPKEKVWVDTKDYKDWRYECRGLEGQKNVTCGIFQTVAWDNTKAKALSVAITYAPVKNKEGKLIVVPHMRFVTPLGSHIPSGVVAKIDEGKEHKLQFAFCSPMGCVVDVGFGGEFVDQMKEGKTLTVNYRRPDGKIGNVNVSLSGFSSSFDALTTKVKELAGG